MQLLVYVNVWLFPEFAGDPSFEAYDEEDAELNKRALEYQLEQYPKHGVLSLDDLNGLLDDGWKVKQIVPSGQDGHAFALLER